MRSLLKLVPVVLVVASLTVTTGCGKKSSAKKPADKPAVEHFEGDGHDHSKDDHAGHDHSKDDHAGHDHK